MAYKDLRDWLTQVDAMGELKVVDGADWNEEIGMLRFLARKETCDAPAVMFDNIKGYPPGFRVVCGTTCSRNRMALAMNIGLEHAVTNLKLISALRAKLKDVKRVPPRLVKTGPVLENVHKGKDIDLFEFPAPKWHNGDGGRYLGTWNFTISRDLIDGWVNLGMYRTMICDKTTLVTEMEPGRHCAIHRQQHFDRGEPQPVVLVFGADPLLGQIASIEVPFGVSEYDVVGGIKGEPVDVIKGPVTGLPIPANAEIAVEAEVSNVETRPEGPYSEFTGYSTWEARPEPAVFVKSVLHRNQPVITGLTTGASPKASQFGKQGSGIHHAAILRSAWIWNEMEAAGVPGVTGVYCHPAGGAHFWTVVAIQQMFPGHAKQAGAIASQCGSSAYAGRYVVVVDEDIDPTDDFAVLWALSTRTDPQADIDILRKCWAGHLDPAVSSGGQALNSRAIITACRPYGRHFAPVVKFNPEIRKRVIERYGPGLYR